MPTRSTGDYLDESQVTYRVPLEFITRVNGCYNDGATTYKFNNSLIAQLVRAPS